MKNQLTWMASFGLAIAMLGSAGAAQAVTPAQNQKFLDKLYQDLLNRTPNRVESATSISLLGLGLTRTQVAGAVTRSKEYLTGQIHQYFGALLNRPANAGELGFFLNYMQQGATNDDVKAVILGGDEYYGFAGATDHAFLNKLFENVLGRPVDRSAEVTLKTMLGHGATRKAVASLILHSAEADRLEVTGLFQKLLNRFPQAAELAAFVQILQTGGKDEYVIDLLCGGDEYFQSANK